jgi:ribosome-associated translation inhibitor RaiA
MNIQIHIRGLNIGSRMRESLEQELEQLQTSISISAVAGVLEYQRDAAPPFRTFVLLAVPGPDIHAEAWDHTLKAAWRKVLADLRKQIEQRKNRPEIRLKENRQEYIPRKSGANPKLGRRAKARRYDLAPIV